MKLEQGTFVGNLILNKGMKPKKSNISPFEGKMYADLRFVDAGSIIDYLDCYSGHWLTAIALWHCCVVLCVYVDQDDTIDDIAVSLPAAVFWINMSSTACFMIISRNDIPIYEAEVGTAPKILLNPLYLPGSRVTSSHFDTKVRALARKYL
ncbi:hypothetical protein Ccrd_004933 [Cynara cardunculus var. scolymus]|uniref:Uncharacterized protein n=1 Tax=Cynara cardunculus var. scolymus TaxID=59895 RepID=A0A103XLM8_CYNCS|nr:hypothetical protein Ccrd_004933 [Cynara cardunculus var. scolymus]